MSQIFEIRLHLPTNQDVNQGVLNWHAFLVKAVTASRESHVHEKPLHKTIISKIMHNSLQFIKKKRK